MAIPSDAPFPLTGSDFVDVITTGYSWQFDSDRTIRWALADGSDGKSWGNADAMQNNIVTMLGYFADYIDVKFEYAGYFPNPSIAYNEGSDITISLAGESVFGSNTNAWGRGLFPNSSYNTSLYTGAPGDIFINADSEANNLSYDRGSAGWHLLIHELGHALGLKHTHDDGGTGRPTASEVDLEQFDIDWASIMSYQDEFEFNRLSWNPATPMPLDIIGLQHLYGTNNNVNAGDTILVTEDTADYRTFRDNGRGTDRIDASLMEDGIRVQLPEPALQRIGSISKISEDDLSSPTYFHWLMGGIEDIVGSDFDDVLKGNEGLNNFQGRAGNDVIGGKSGTDYAQYGIAIDQVLELVAEDDIFRVNTGSSSTEGNDVLFDIERLVFTDGYIAIDINGVGGKAYRIYQAAFDRTPDAEGVGYWIAQMDRGMEVTEVASRFIDSDEFRSQYGEAPSNDQFLTALYSNVLDREPDNEGFVWWLDQLDNNPEKIPNQVLADFSESPENQNNVIDIIGNGFAYTFWDPAAL